MTNEKAEARKKRFAYLNQLATDFNELRDARTTIEGISSTADNRHVDTEDLNFTVHSLALEMFAILTVTPVDNDFMLVSYEVQTLRDDTLFRSFDRNEAEKFLNALPDDQTDHVELIAKLWLPLYTIPNFEIDRGSR